MLGVAALAGCGALVGVTDLEVTGDATVEVPDATPPAKDSGPPQPIVDATPPADVDGSPPPTRPAPGVYTYSLTGHDEVKQISWNKSYDGTKGTVTITHEGESCFTEAVHIRQDYDETFHFCQKGSDFVQDTGTRAQKFSFGFGAATNQECKPGDVYFPQAPVAAQSWTHDCLGSNAADGNGKKGGSTFRTVGPFTFVGPEVKTVAGTNVDVYHYHDDRVVSDSQKGTNKAEWFISRSGVLVRLERTITITYDSFIGPITYAESLTMMLDALLPLPLPP